MHGGAGAELSKPHGHSAGGARMPEGFSISRNRSEAAIPVILSSAGSGGVCKDLGECEGGGAVLCSAVDAVPETPGQPAAGCTVRQQPRACWQHMSDRTYPCAGSSGVCQEPGEPQQHLQSSAPLARTTRGAFTAVCHASIGLDRVAFPSAVIFSCVSAGGGGVCEELGKCQ